MEKKLSHKLEQTLVTIESQISKYISEHSFYLDFRNKRWASCPCGQALLALTTLATNLRYDIDSLKKHGL